MSLSAIVPYNKNGLGLVSVLINLQLQVRPNDLDTIIVIDTSKDQSGKRIAETFLSRKGINAYVVVKEVNVYEAWNEGIKLSKGKDCLIINDDILMPNNFLKNLKKARELEPNALCFVPRTPVMSYVGSYPPSYFSWQSDDLTDNTKLKKTGWMPGFVFYLTKECIDKVGMFDLGFKIWFGDNDIGRRIKEKGNIIQVPDYVFHYGSRSYNYLNPEIKKQIYKDKNYYERKWKKQDK
jgi:GT2 family glycosyltransferase